MAIENYQSQTRLSNVSFKCYQSMYNSQIVKLLFRFPILKFKQSNFTNSSVKNLFRNKGRKTYKFVRTPFCTYVDKVCSVIKFPSNSFVNWRNGCISTYMVNFGCSTKADNDVSQCPIHTDTAAVTGFCGISQVYHIIGTYMRYEMIQM